MSKQRDNLDGMEENNAVISASHYQNLDAEKVLDRLGKYGTYQMIIYSMSCIGLLLYATETMIMSLIAKDVNFSCLSNDPDLEVIDKCTVKSVSTNESFVCGRVSKTNLIFDDITKLSLIGEFELVCDKSTYASHGTSIFMIAIQFGTPVIASLSDKYGRRLTYLLPLWIAVIANILCCLAPNYYLFLVFRFFAGIGSAGMGSVGFVIQIETTTASFRSISPLLVTFVWVFGYIIVGVLHIFIPNWRYLYFCVSAPALITFIFYWFMPESIHWSISNKRSKQVSRYIKQSCRLNRKQIELHECKSQACIEDVKEESPKRGFLSILKSGPIMFNLFIHCYIVIVMNLAYWALSLFSVDLHENEMVGYFLSGFVELPAGFISIALLLYFGRRFVTFASLLAQAGCMLLAVFYPGKSWISMSFPLMAKVFNSITWASEPLLAGEMSPTTIRNVFFGCNSFVGEFGSIVAPYINTLKDLHPLAPPFVIFVMSVLAAFAALCSPETRNKPLPETIEDFDSGPVYRWLFGNKKKANIDAEETTSKEKESITLL